MICIECSEGAVCIYKGNSLCHRHFLEAKSPEKKAIEHPGIKTLIAHINQSYKSKNGCNYPMGYDSIKICQKLLKTLNLSQIRALWDVFMARDWDWKNQDGVMVKVPYDLRIFKNKLTIIMEDSSWRTRMIKYETEKVNEPKKKDLELKLDGLLKPVKGVKHETRESSM